MFFRKKFIYSHNIVEFVQVKDYNVICSSKIQEEAPMLNIVLVEPEIPQNC